MVVARISRSDSRYESEQVTEQLSRQAFPFPTVEIAKAPTLFDYDYENFTVVDYRHHPAIKAPVAV